jgi:hypothetical protein
MNEPSEATRIEWVASALTWISERTGVRWSVERLAEHIWGARHEGHILCLHADGSRMSPSTETIHRQRGRSTRRALWRSVKAAQAACVALDSGGHVAIAGMIPQSQHVPLGTPRR